MCDRRWHTVRRLLAGAMLLMSLVATMVPVGAHAAMQPLAPDDAFVVTDIRVQGLQRVSAGTVFNLLPVNVGDTLDSSTARDVIRTLFKSGYFEDITLLRDNGVLVINVEERPAIDSIEIDGNDSISTEALLSGLEDQGMSVGEIFRRATLERVDLELERQYVAQGRYGAHIDARAEPLPRNRVAIKIDIEEGKPASIRHVNIVGNERYSDAELLDLFELQLPSLLSFYTNSDKYSREKLAGDLERLESWYQDRGYVNFTIESTQVSVSPDKRNVFITINVHEGDVYKVRNVELVGELNDVPPESVERLLVLEPGETFSRARVTATEELIVKAFGNSGYTFASASGVPTPNDDGTVDVRFFVESGKRVYVRRVSFAGNDVTHDEVLRREMRQMEAGWASTALIDLSKVRLERLGFFREVSVETPAVPGTDDQIDVEFSVEEQPSGSISATLGFAQGAGLIIGGGYQENNVLGSGNSLGLQISYSKFQQAVSFNFFDPYYTIDGISRGYNMFFRKTDFDQGNIARFSTDAWGGGVSFGFPIGETQRLGFGMNLEHTKITEGVFAAREIAEFIDDNGDTSLNFKVNGTWRSSTLNRGLFPTRGRSQQLSVEASTPGSDLLFYKIRYEGQQYFGLPGPFSMRLRTEAAYADSFNGNVPFYEHYFSGGFGSVRGYKSNTLVPRSTPNGNDIFTQRKGDPFGGNLLFEASAEIILPVPVEEVRGQLRPVVFVDAGQVYNTECPRVSQQCFGFDWGKLRYSTGVAVTWITGFGPISLAIAKTFGDDQFDETELFQFELGQTF